MKNITYLALLCLVFLATSSTSLAYFTTNQSAVRVTDTTSIFMIEYKFGHGSYEIRMPVLTERKNGVSDNKVLYNFYNEDNEVLDAGNATGIVLSDAEVLDGMYVIPKGKSKTLTLLVIFENQTPDDVRLQVEYLPFQFNNTQHLRLNPSELQYYTTPFLKF